MNPIKTLIEKIKDYIENRKIKKLPNKEVLKDIKNPPEESIIPEDKIPFAIENMQGKEAKTNGLIAAIETVPEQIKGVTDCLAPQVIAGVYKVPEYKRILRDNLGVSDLGRVIKTTGNEYNELYNIAGTLDKNNFEFKKIIANTISESDYDSEKISEIISRRMAKMISVYRKPLQYQILLSVLKSDEERKEIPKALEGECEKLKNEIKKNKPNSKEVNNLEQYDSEKMEEQIEQYIKSKADLKGKDKKGIEPGD